MITRQPFRIVASTLGAGPRSPVELGGGYRYRGTEGWNPAAGVHGEDEGPGRRKGNAGAQARAQGKAERFRAFCQLREQGKSLRETAEHPDVNVQMKTARAYERERRAAQDGESS